MTLNNIKDLKSIWKCSVFYVELRLNSTLTSFRQAAKQASFVEVNIRAWKSWSFLFRFQYRARILMMNSTLSFPSICLFGTLSKFQGRLQTRSDRIDIFTWERWLRKHHHTIITWKHWIIRIGILPCSIGWLLSVAVLMGCWPPFHSATKWRLHVLFTSRK